MKFATLMKSVPNLPCDGNRGAYWYALCRARGGRLATPSCKWNVSLRSTMRHSSANLLFLIMLLWCCADAFAQQSGWEPIPADELALKDDLATPGASALILYRDNIADDKKGVMTEHFRIKVLRDEGKKYADIEIPTSKAFKIESKDIEARTVRPDGTSVPFTGEIHDKTVVKTRNYIITEKTFTLPDVQIGGIVEMRYRARYQKNEFPNHTWEVQSELFTRHAHFELRPDSATVANIRYVTKGHQQPPLANGEVWALDVQNVPALEKEDFTLPESELRSQVDFFYCEPGMTQDLYWEQKAHNIGDYLNAFIGKNNKVKNEVARLTTPSDSPEAKLRKLYTRAQQVRKVNFDSIESNREKLHEAKHVDDVLDRGYGNTGDISVLLAAMAREVGYQSGLVLVTDRDRGLFHPEVLSVAQLTAEMTWVEKDGKFTLLDPACQKCPYGLISWDQAGASGIRTNYLGSVYVRVPADKAEDATLERKGDLRLEANGSLAGLITVAIGGLEALELRSPKENADEPGRKKAVTDLVKSSLPDAADVRLQTLSNWDDIDKPIVAELTIDVPGYAVTTGKRLLMPASPFTTKSQAAFAHDTRDFAVVFHNPYRRIDDLTIVVPAGYQVESVPDGNRSTSMILDYSLQVQNKDHTIHISRAMTNHAVYVPTQYYRQLQLDYNRVKATDEQQAVLRQSTTASR